MITMIAFWIVLLVIILMLLFRAKNKRINRTRYDSFLGLLIVYQSLLLIMAIVTKDPIFTPIGLPVEYEWIAGILTSGALSWWYYLKPMKDRVVKLETRTASINAKLDGVKETMDWIKSNCNVSLKKR
jgi:predicted ferric reductase